MRQILITALLHFMLVFPALAADRELGLAREMLEDAILRDDAEGMQLARERLLRIVADADDRTTLRDAHYLVALSAFFESINGWRDAAASGRIAMTGVRHADRALELDPQFADAWMIGSGLRRTAMRGGQPVPPDPAGAPNRFLKALELDAQSPAVAFTNGMVRAMNPLGPANPDGVQIIDDLAARLDADRAATGRRFGLWDAEAHVFKIMVRIAADVPDAATLRPMAAELMKQRPDFALGQIVAESLAEHRFVAPPAVPWQPFLIDAAGDGKAPKNPDVVSVDRAESGDRVWYRVAYRETLPPSFGANIAVNRSGDAATGMQWWGGGSTARFDRLVTVWITRDGDRYFGRVGVTDDDGARGARFSKLTSDVQLAMSDDRSVMIGVPKSVLGLTDKSTIVVAGGTHLVWNDDAASAANSR